MTKYWMTNEWVSGMHNRCLTFVRSTFIGSSAWLLYSIRLNVQTISLPNCTQLGLLTGKLPIHFSYANAFATEGRFGSIQQRYINERERLLFHIITQIIFLDQYGSIMVLLLSFAIVDAFQIAVDYDGDHGRRYRYQLYSRRWLDSRQSGDAHSSDWIGS